MRGRFAQFVDCLNYLKTLSTVAALCIRFPSTSSIWIEIVLAGGTSCFRLPIHSGVNISATWAQNANIGLLGRISVLRENVGREQVHIDIAIKTRNNLYPEEVQNLSGLAVWKPD